MAYDSNLVLMDKERIKRSLNRMAHEIAERNSEDRSIILFGIDERGYAVAQELADLLNPIFDSQVQVLQLSLKDDNSSQVFEPLHIEKVKDQFLVAVDDVIFTGQTMFTALKIISDGIDPSEIYTALLIDRGHRKFPIKAEFCGMELPTKLNEHVSVVVEDNSINEVVLTSG